MSEAEIIRNSWDAGDPIGPGCRIGHYKLLEQIGEGGTGIVFVADQVEPVRRRVAIKLVKLGMDTKSVIARFETERQALALMDHPGIAHVFDAGATESGRPYFVLQCVRGTKITEYCDQHSLTIQNRLELFIQVCDAIQHAHQKGIIHRDIKPSNILVTTGSDGKPAPKVIDFGIAKAIGGQLLTDKTLFTACEMLVATPAYMSPEQAALVSTGVDTRSDIYSLGVLLYELLTGSTPFDTTELLKAGFDEVRRVVREEEPVRPSVRLQTLIVANTAPPSRQCRAGPPKLVREMRGDLDWIVMKALEKDPTRRYATANGLAIDIRRYLSGQAVEARPPSASYKLRKLFLRNKLLFISLASIFFLLVVALAAAGRLLAVERRAVHLSEALKYESQAGDCQVAGKINDAEAAMEKSLEIRKKYLDNEPPAPWTMKSLVVDLLNIGRPNDATALLQRAVTLPLMARRPEYSDLCSSYVAVFANAGKWEDAVPYATLMMKLRPKDSDSYHELAPLLAATTNIADYHDLCARIVMTFSNTTDPLVANQMAKDCLILPSSGVNLNAVAAMANVAVTAGAHSSKYQYYVCTEALAQYRLGNYSEATHWAQAADYTRYPYPEAEAYAIIAMAQYRLGNTNAADQAFSHSNQVIRDKLPQPGTHIDDWRNWILARALQSEATQMINAKPSSAAAPKVDLPR